MIRIYVGIFAISMAALGYYLWPADQQEERMAKARQRFDAYGCGSCHQMDGTQNAVGRVGPKLVEMRGRAYLAGHLPNTPDNLVRWIRFPQDIDPKTVMPNLNVSQADALELAHLIENNR